MVEHKVPRDGAARASQPVPEPIELAIPGSRCFGCAPHNPHGLKLRFYRVGQRVVSKCAPPRHFEGWFGMWHAGILTSMLDELAAWTVIGLQQRIGLTRDMSTRFRRPLYAGETVTLRGEIVGGTAALVKVAGQLANERGDICVEADIAVFTLSREQCARMLPGGSIPPELGAYF